MPATFNGCGTRYYGKCNHRADGSFITTEWITFFYCPIVPIRSFRLVRDAGKDSSAVLVHSLGYGIIEKLAIYWPQARRIYLFMLLSAFWCFGVLFLFLDLLKVFEKSDNIGMMVVIMILMTVPWFYLWWRRHTDAKRVA